MNFKEGIMEAKFYQIMISKKIALVDGVNYKLIQGSPCKITLVDGWKTVSEKGYPNFSEVIDISENGYFL